MSEIYDPQEVTFNVNGRFITGYAEDGHIKAEPMTAEKVTSQVGVNGEGAWSANRDERWKVTIVLMQNSPSNAYLDNLSKLNTKIIGSLKNTSDGGYVGGGTDGRITERVAKEFGKDQKNRTWVIVFHDWLDKLS